MSTGKKNLLPSYQVYEPEDLGKQWFVYWYEGTKRRRVYGDINGGKTLEERKARAAALVGELKKKDVPLVSVVEERVREYLAQNEGRWRRKTREQYASVTNVLFAWMAGRKVTEETVTAFLMDVQQKKHATTYNKYRRMVKYLLGKVGLETVTDATTTMRAESTPARYFQAHQMKRLGAHLASEEDELWLFAQFIFYCFIRPQELRYLRAGDVLLEERQIRVPAAVSKNRKTQYVAIPDVFLPALIPLLDMAPGEYLFPSPRDASKPVGVNAMYMRHRKALGKLNFGEGYSLYSWKHSGAVAAVKAGVSVKELQIQLRHHSLDETDKYLRQMGVRDLGTLQSKFPAAM